MPDQSLDELANIEKQLLSLRERHRTALTAGDLAELKRVQVELAEVMERRDQLVPS